MLDVIPFYFLRHGQSTWNREGRVQGRRDVPLSEEGRAQAERARALLAGTRIGTVVASPLARALETARIVNGTLGRPLVVLDELAECGLGALEGQCVPYDDWHPRWRKGEGWPEGAETYEDFIARGLRAMNLALAQEGPVLVVAHGGIYWSVQRHARLDEGAVLPNAVPVYHRPPSPDVPGWLAEALEDRAGPAPTAV